MMISSPDSWPRHIRILLKAAAVTFLGLLIWQSLTPGGVNQQTIPHFDKVMHFSVYGVLAGLIRLGWWRVWGGFILAFCIALGFGLEFLQGWMDQGRSASIWDGIANMLGAAVSLYIIPRIWNR